MAAAAVLTVACGQAREPARGNEPAATEAPPAATAPTVVTADFCTDATSREQAWLPAEWKPFARYTRTCTVMSGDRKPAVLLLSVWAERYYNDQPSPATQVDLPKPVLFSPEGVTLGSLPYNFPDDPPTELTVTFTDWVNGFPRGVELFLKDPAAGGDRALAPLVWDEANKRYATSR